MPVFVGLLWLAALFWRPSRPWSSGLLRLGAVALGFLLGMFGGGECDGDIGTQVDSPDMTLRTAFAALFLGVVTLPGLPWLGLPLLAMAFTLLGWQILVPLFRADDS